MQIVLVHFNSSIVRLKDAEYKHEHNRVCGFQFKYCTIKRENIAGNGSTAINFNSSIVRLKARESPSISATSSLFQFKYCTIKSQMLLHQ